MPVFMASRVATCGSAQTFFRLDPLHSGFNRCAHHFPRCQAAILSRQVTNLREQNVQPVQVLIGSSGFSPATNFVVTFTHRGPVMLHRPPAL
jgi:hypothetical protein